MCLMGILEEEKTTQFEGWKKPQPFLSMALVYQITDQVQI